MSKEQTSSASLMAQFKKNTKLKFSTAFDDSIMIKNDSPNYPTLVPAINVALTGKLDQGMGSGILILAGPPKHFKSLFALLMAKSFLEKEKDGVILFYDCEFGITKDYMTSLGIDTTRVHLTHFTDLEELTFDFVAQLKALERKHKVMVLVDSLGNTASKKEAEDAENSKGTTDMSRAKKMKSLFRLITPHLKLKDIPFVGITHTYKTQDLFPKDTVSGGEGQKYSANDIWIIGRRQEKAGTEINGWTFIINIEKSRCVKEKAKIPVQVMYEGGINRWTALTDWALESGHLHKPTAGWYQVVDPITGEVSEKKYRANDLNGEVFTPIINRQDFKDFIYNKFKLSSSGLLTEDAGGIETGIIDLD